MASAKVNVVRFLTLPSGRKIKVLRKDIMDRALERMNNRNKKENSMEEFITFELQGVDLADLIDCAKTKTREFWEKRFPLMYSDTEITNIMMGHYIIDEFKFFTVSPACIYFYVDDQGNLRKEAAIVKSKLFEKNDFNVNPHTMILLGLFKRDGKIIIQYAETKHQILT